VERTRVIAELGRFHPGGLQPPGPALQDYWRHYGLAPAHSAGLLRVAGYDIACQVFVPEQAVGSCFLVHGYFDHLGLYRHAIAALLAQGYAVVGFDLPGHGLSSGEPGVVGSFFDYHGVLHHVVAACETLPRPWVALGLSTGAAIVATYSLLSRQRSFEHQLLLAPLVRPRAWLAGMLAYPLLNPVVRRLPRRYADTSTDEAFKAFLRRDVLQPRHLPLRWVGALRAWQRWLLAQAPSEQPTLLLQGEQDRTVDWRYNVRVLQRLFPRTQLHTYSQARHHLVNEAPAIREAVLKDIAHYLDGAVCGRDPA